MSQSVRATAVAVLLVLVALAPATTGGVGAQEDVVALTLEVVDGNGDPVGGVELDVSWEGGSETVTTRSNGRVFVDVPAGSTPEIAVSHDVYMRNHPFVVENVSADTVQIPVARSGTVDVTVAGSTGPVADASVRLVRNGRNAAAVRSDGDGMAVAGPVERGEYGLVVAKPGYVTNVTDIRVTGDHQRTVEIRPGAVQIRFNVTDDHFAPAEAVEKARINIGETGDTLSTLDNGQRATTVPVNREYTVTVAKDGYEEVQRAVSVGEEGTVVDLTINRRRGLNLELVNRRVVLGESTVVRATDEYGDPIEGASVALDGAIVGETDASGAVQIPINQTGDNTVTVTAGSLSNSTVVEGIEASQGTTETTTATTTTTTSDGGGPGFTAVTALLAVVAVVVAAVRRRRS
jgi:PGF-CTERM protein